MQEGETGPDLDGAAHRSAAAHFAPRTPWPSSYQGWTFCALNLASGWMWSRKALAGSWLIVSLPAGPALVGFHPDPRPRWLSAPLLKAPFEECPEQCGISGEAGDRGEAEGLGGQRSSEEEEGLRGTRWELLGRVGNSEPVILELGI